MAFCCKQENILTLDGDRAKEISHPQIKRAFQVLSFTCCMQSSLVVHSAEHNAYMCWGLLTCQGVLLEHLKELLCSSHINEEAAVLCLEAVYKVLSHACRHLRTAHMSPGRSCRRATGRV